MLVLRHLIEHEDYGASVARALTLQQGTVYPILKRLVRDGYLSRRVEGEELKQRGVYEVTLTGLELFKELRKRYGR